MKKLGIVIVCLFSGLSAGFVIGRISINTEQYKELITFQQREVEASRDSVKMYKEYFDSFTEKYDSIEDSLKTELFISKYKLERIKQYDSIVIRNSSQAKFFRGWVRRVIYD